MYRKAPTPNNPNDIPRFLNEEFGKIEEAFVNNTGMIETFAKPAPTIASASSIILSAPITFVSGTNTISTINAQSTSGILGIIPIGSFLTNTSGNIAVATTCIINRVLFFYYDNVTQKFYPSY